jgi:hypothetical protein
MKSRVVIFTVTRNGTITGSHSLVPDEMFTVNTPEDDKYVGSIYAIHLDHNATLELVGDGIHEIVIGETYTVQRRAREKNYQLTTTRPGPGHNTHVHSTEPAERPNPSATTNSNGDLYVGSGG